MEPRCPTIASATSTRPPRDLHDERRPLLKGDGTVGKADDTHQTIRSTDPSFDIHYVIGLTAGNDSRRESRKGPSKYLIKTLSSVNEHTSGRKPLTARPDIEYPQNRSLKVLRPQRHLQKSSRPGTQTRRQLVLHGHCAGPSKAGAVKIICGERGCTYD